MNDLSSRALEIAAAHVGQPADAGFASSSFDLAVPFARARGIAKTGTVRPGMIFTPSSGTAPSLVEQITQRGVIMFETIEGRLSRVFHPTNELGGSFTEVTEGIDVPRQPDAAR